MALSTRIPRPAAARSKGEGLAVVGVALFAHEPAKLARFYDQVLRTSLEHRVHDDGREHWIARMGGVHLEIKALSTASGAPTPDAHESGQPGGMGRMELSFRVPDVSTALYRAVEAGARVLQEAETFPWGTWAVVVDPEGNRLGLFTPPQSDTNSDPEDQA